MHKFWFKYYRFIYFLFKRYYYPDDIIECHRHTHVIFSLAVISPLFGILLSFGFEISFCHECDELANKFFLTPVIAVLFLVTYFLIRIARFKEKVKELEQKGFNFQNFTLFDKVVRIFLYFIWIISAFWIPVISELIF